VDFEFIDNVEISGGIVTISCTLWFSAFEPGAAYWFGVREQGSSAQNFCDLTFRWDGTLVRYYQTMPELLATYEAETVHELIVSFDMDAGTMSVWWNGLRVLADAPHGIVGHGVGKLLFGCEHDEDLCGRFHIDDVLVTDEVVVSAVGNDLQPARLQLSCYPNPFNPATTISFDLAHTEPVVLEILDLTGRHVRTLHQGPLAAGPQRFRWNGFDEHGQAAASGCYLYRVAGRDWNASRSMLLVR
jgi:hypothetical protein